MRVQYGCSLETELKWMVGGERVEGHKMAAFLEISKGGGKVRGVSEYGGVFRGTKLQLY